MKHLLITIAAVAAFGQDITRNAVTAPFVETAKAKAATPEVPKLELTEMKLTATTAQNVVMRLELLKAQYNELLKEQQRLQVELEQRFTAVYTKAGAKREDWDLDPDKGVFVRKEAAKK